MLPHLSFSDLVGLGRSPSICILGKFLGDTDAASPETLLPGKEEEKRKD